MHALAADACIAQFERAARAAFRQHQLKSALHERAHSRALHARQSFRFLQTGPAISRVVFIWAAILLYMGTHVNLPVMPQKK